MSLSIFDPTQGCYVLNPKEFNPIINAFHPDYVKTYMPEFMSSIRLAETQKINGEKVAKKTPMKMNSIRPSLEPTDFRVYSKAGASNVTPKGKKK